MKVSVDAIRDLRSRTMCGVVDCKTALAEANGDVAVAVDLLRKRGIAKAQAKAGRVSNCGLVGVMVKDLKGAIIELNSETDFVAKSVYFQDLAKGIVEAAFLMAGDSSSISGSCFPGADCSVGDKVTEVAAVVGENIQLRRVGCVNVDDGVVASYVHNSVADGLGRIGVLVGLKTSCKVIGLEIFARQLAMHVAAHDPSPTFICVEDISPNVLQSERAIFVEQAKLSGKSSDVLERIVDGRMRKFYEEVVLLNQRFVINPEMTVSEAISDVARRSGTTISISSFVRYAVGE